MGQPVSPQKVADCPDNHPEGRRSLKNRWARRSGQLPGGIMQYVPSSPNPATVSLTTTEPGATRHQSTLVQYRDGRPDVYQTVTDRLVTALEAGVVPWVRPWTNAGASAIPRNGSTHRTYSGVNVLLLWLTALERNYASPEWFTARQAKVLGGYVRKGERGTLVTFWRTVTVSDRKNDTSDVVPRQIPLLRYYVVFNRAQIEGLPNVEPPVEMPGTLHNRLDDLEHFVARSGAVVTEHAAASVPCYHLSTDRIEMPPLARFTTREDYYAALLHELAHWTGHATRLARPMSGVFGTPSYAPRSCAPIFN
jgi:antirestriction protein ArdC